MKTASQRTRQQHRNSVLRSRPTQINLGSQTTGWHHNCVIVAGCMVHCSFLPPAWLRKNNLHSQCKFLFSHSNGSNSMHLVAWLLIWVVQKLLIYWIFSYNHIKDLKSMIWKRENAQWVTDLCKKNASMMLEFRREWQECFNLIVR